MQTLFNKTTLVIMMSTLLFACGKDCCEPPVQIDPKAQTKLDQSKASQTPINPANPNDRDGDGIENSQDAKPDDKQVAGIFYKKNIAKNKDIIQLRFDAKGRETYKKYDKNLTQTHYDQYDNVIYSKTEKEGSYSEVKRHEYDYDNGRMIRKKTQRELDGKKSIEITTYDKNGHTLRKTFDNEADGNIDLTSDHTNTVYENGKIKQVIKTDKRANQQGNFVTTIQYDKNGNITYDEQKNTKGEIKGKITQYDANNKQTYSAEFALIDGVKNLANQITRKYDQQGNLTYQEDGDYILQKTYDKQGNVLTESSGNDGQIRVVKRHTYDKNNNLIKTTSENTDGHINSIISYDYDKNNNRIKTEKDQDADGNIDTSIIVTYDDKNRILSHKENKSFICEIAHSYDDTLHSHTMTKKVDGKALRSKKTQYADKTNQVMIKFSTDNDGDGNYDYQNSYDTDGRPLKTYLIESGKLQPSIDYIYQGTINKEADLNPQLGYARPSLELYPYGCQSNY